MTNPTFKVSQELEIESPEPCKALPISHHEWETIKAKVGSLRTKKSFAESCGWKDIGMVFLGVALATFVSLWVPGYSTIYFRAIAWAVVIIFALLCGCFVFFQYQLDKMNDEKSTITASGILEIMDLVEAGRSSLKNKY